MQVTVKTTISREKLNKSRYVPDSVTIIESAQISGEAKDDFYRPAVKLLGLLSSIHSRV